MAPASLNPPYPDAFSEQQLQLNDDTRKTILTSKWDAVHKFSFPSRYVGGKFRKIQCHWFINNTWLRYSPSKEGVYCGPCHLFGAKDATSKQKSLTAVAVTDPSNIGKIIKTHEPSSMHTSSCEAAHFVLAVLEGKKKDIVSSISSAHEEQVAKNRAVLIAIVDTISFCGKQNIAIRGHEDEKSNFTALLQLQAKHTPVLRDHLSNCCTRNKYTSPDVQNELISICEELQPVQ